MPLTDKGLRSLRAGPKDQFVSDGDRLYVRVRPSGSKTFVLRSQVGRSSRWVTLGTYPEMSLADARREAAAQSGRVVTAPVTFAEAWAQYERHILRTLRRPANYQFFMNTYLLPTLGPKLLRSITRAEVSRVLQAVVDRGAPVAANRSMTVVRLMFRFAEARGLVDHNVLEKLTASAVGGSEARRTRHLTATEVSLLIHAMTIAPRLPYKRKLAYGLLLLTGQRRNEVLGMRAEEVAGAWWTIPADRTKPKRAQKVYLSPQARVLWRDATRRFGPTPFRDVIPTTFSDGFGTLVARAGVPHSTIHDLRRTMATRLSDEGIPPHVIEKMLNHQMEGVMAIYNRAEYLTERREAWRLWGRLVNQWRKKAPGERAGA